jgi:hypothetical protein
MEPQKDQKPARVKKPQAETEPPAETPTEQKKPARPKKVSPVDIAIAKYQENGWNVIKPPKGAVNDFLASRNGRFHFVNAITTETADEPKFHGEAKNNFVQNAFSNGATPVFAHVQITKSGPKVTYEDVNTGNRVLINQKSRQKDEDSNAAKPQPAKK